MIGVNLTAEYCMHPVFRSWVMVVQIGPLERRIDDVSRVRGQLVALSITAQMLGLDPEQAGFHHGGTAEPP
jgi:hypothetical protein